MDDTNFTTPAVLVAGGLLLFAIIWWRVAYRIRKRRASPTSEQPVRPPPPIFRHEAPPPQNVIGQGQFNPYAQHPHHHSHPHPPFFHQQHQQQHPPILSAVPPPPPPRQHTSTSHPPPRPDQPPQPPRFDPENLVSFEATGKDKSTACAICLDPLEREPVSTGQCLHIMHTSCLKDWLVKDPKSACPVCRVSYHDSSSLDFENLAPNELEAHLASHAGHNHHPAPNSPPTT